MFGPLMSGRSSNDWGGGSSSVSSSRTAMTESTRPPWIAASVSVSSNTLSNWSTVGSSRFTPVEVSGVELLPRTGPEGFILFPAGSPDCSLSFSG